MLGWYLVLNEAWFNPPNADLDIIKKNKKNLYVTCIGRSTLYRRCTTDSLHIGLSWGGAGIKSGLPPVTRIALRTKLRFLSVSPESVVGMY